MTLAHGSTRTAVRAAIRSVQVQERAAARTCPDCRKPLPEDLRARLTVGAIAKTGRRYVSRGRPETDAELDCCVCPPVTRGFRLRTTAHHRTDDEAQRIIYAVIDQLRAYSHVRGVTQRVEFRSRRAGREWLQHIEISGSTDTWPFVDTIAQRHPGWLLTRT